MPDDRPDTQRTPPAAHEPPKPTPHSEELLRLVAENVEDYAIFAVDLGGNVASWNRGVERLLGYAEDEWVGQDACIIFTPEDQERDACGRELRAAREQGRAEDRRWHLRKDGSRFWANGLMILLEDDAGAPRGYAKIMRDETGRKRAEDALRESEARYRSFVTATEEVLWLADACGNLTLVPDWQTLTGRAAGTELGWAWLDAVHPEDRERTRANWLRSIETGSLYHNEHRLRARDGSYRRLAVRAAPVRGDDGAVREWVGTATDVTERERAETKLRERERQLEAQFAQLEAIYATTPVGLSFVGRDMCFVRINERLAEINNLPAREHIGRSLREVLPGLGEQLETLYRRVFDTGEPVVDLELRAAVPARPDAVRDWLLGYYPVRGDGGEIIGIHAVVQDITERKRAEAERERLLREAQEANRLRDEFLATLSHELRTPLTAILGWAQLVRTDRLDELAFSKAIDVIERNARTQVQLIDDLLDVSRIITGKLRMDVRAVDLPAVVSAAADTLRPAAEAKGIRLQLLLDPRASPVSGDPDRLQQVVWNLVSNAIKFTPRGGSVQVRLERVGSHVEIVVSDTGAGVPAEFLPHVFDRFRQADQTTTRQHGGLGLGLAIVRQLVELHGGTVSAESAGEDCGAIFRVSLPLAPVRTEPAGDYPRVHTAASRSALLDCPPEIADLRVLVVDDEPDTRELLAFVLTRCGAQVFTAGSAKEGLEMLRRELPDVLVSDIGMPGQDGYSFLFEVRGLPKEQGGATPAVALTAYARAEDRVRAFRAGFQLHVPKPVEPAELVTVVANLAGRIGRS